MELARALLSAMMQRMKPELGSSSAAAVAAAAVAAINRAVPGRVRLVCVIGSHADGSAIPTSDLDLVVWLQGSADPSEIQRAAAAATAATAGSVPTLDLTVSGETDPTWEKRSVRSCSVLVAGEDIRDLWPPPSDHVDDEHVVESIAYAMRTVRDFWRAGRQLRLPLLPPRPCDEFLGYLRSGVTDGLRDVVSAVGILAKARIELGTRARVHTKEQAFRRYRELLDDEWSSFVEDLYETMRVRWHHLVPAAHADRKRLSDMLVRLLAFENATFAESVSWLRTVDSGEDFADAVRILLDDLGVTPN